MDPDKFSTRTFTVTDIPTKMDNPETDGKLPTKIGVTFYVGQAKNVEKAIENRGKLLRAIRQGI